VRAASAAMLASAPARSSAGRRAGRSFASPFSIIETTTAMRGSFWTDFSARIVCERRFAQHRHALGQRELGERLIAGLGS